MKNVLMFLIYAITLVIALCFVLFIEHINRPPIEVDLWLKYTENMIILERLDTEDAPDIIYMDVIEPGEDEVIHLNFSCAKTEGEYILEKDHE